MPYEGACRFFEWVGIKPVLMIPWASERSNDELQVEFLTWGNNIFSETQMLIAPSIAEMISDLSFRNIFFHYLLIAGGIFFCGGDQNRITHAFTIIDGLKESIIDVYNKGIPCAGTSAGAAIMSHTMLTGKGSFDVIGIDKTETSIGLGFIKNAVIDQHFVKRQRLNRLLSVLLGTCAYEPYGIGVDEDMSVAIEDGIHCEVLGPSTGTGSVIFIERTDIANKFSISILWPGDKFDINRVV